jgi:hypothetical protein
MRTPVAIADPVEMSITTKGAERCRRAGAFSAENSVRTIIDRHVFNVTQSRDVAKNFGVGCEPLTALSVCGQVAMYLRFARAITGDNREQAERLRSPCLKCLQPLLGIHGLADLDRAVMAHLDEVDHHSGNARRRRPIRGLDRVLARGVNGRDATRERRPIRIPSEAARRPSASHRKHRIPATAKEKILPREGNDAL